MNEKCVEDIIQETREKQQAAEKQNETDNMMSDDQVLSIKEDQDQASEANTITNRDELRQNNDDDDFVTD